MDHATLANAPKEVDLDGRRWLVSALSFREWGAVQSFLKQHVPGPLASFKSSDLAGLDPDDRKQVLEVAAAAQKAWPPRIGSAAWFTALDNPGGQAAFLMAALGKHHPSLTEAEAEAISGRVSLAEVLPVVLACLGIEPAEAEAAGGKAGGRAGKRKPRSRTTPATSSTGSPSNSAGITATSSA